jgi:glycosyltransferase involved in cell wall biosynthesis
MNKPKVIVVLPAYNASRTLCLTVNDLPKEIIDDIILVDDASSDNTVEIAESLGCKIFRHSKNKGYGGNQKSCYIKALEAGADIVVMVHPDYQYDPKLISELIKPIKDGYADAVFGSRMMKKKEALEGGMPIWKYYGNILLTKIANIILGVRLSEYHSGFRAYSSTYLKSVNFIFNSDNFVFDVEIIIQGLIHNMRIKEIPIKTRYFKEASTIKFISSIIYGLQILLALIKYILYIKGICNFKQFK